MMALTYAEACGALSSRLSPVSMAHVEAVAECAGVLAVRYGVDRDRARLAGLLHDWCKETPHDELVAQARSHGIPITEVDLARPYLLHGPVGAALLAEAYPDLPDAIVRAVEIHTFGATTMSDLDRVVYVADTISSDRDFAGVHKLRAAVATATLGELLTAAYARSIRHIVKGRRPLHPTTLAVWNTLALAQAGAR
jgi:predicted HD superfamily hydrolase involved in NAD metabolism